MTGNRLLLLFSGFFFFVLFCFLMADIPDLSCFPPLSMTLPRAPRGRGERISLSLTPFVINFYFVFIPLRNLVCQFAFLPSFRPYSIRASAHVRVCCQRCCW